MKLVLAALLASISFSSANAANLEGLEAKLDAFVARHRTHPEMGVAVGVVEDGKLVFQKSYGLRDREKKLPVTADTLFAIGSCTKSFVALGAAMLHDEGKLGLDRPVRSVLPDFALADLQASQVATFTDLLTHRVGLPRHDLLWYVAPFGADELYARLPFLSMNRKPGFGFREGHQYNNLMYLVLGRAIGAASGGTWEAFTKERLLKPLGLASANFAVEESQRAADFAQPYAGAQLLPFRSLPQVAPAGAINASVADMARFVGFLQAGGATTDGKRLVSDDAFARLLKPESEGKIPEVGVTFQYGLGLFLNEVAGRKVAWHGGNIDGFSAHYSFLPGEKLGLVVLTNESAGMAFEFPWKLVRDGGEQKLLPYIVYEHLLGEQDRGLGLEDNRNLVTHLAAQMAALPRPPTEAVARAVTEATAAAATATETGTLSGTGSGAENSAEPGPATDSATGNSLLPSSRAQVLEDLGYGMLYLREQEGRLALDYYGTLLPLEPTLFHDLFHAPSLSEPGKLWTVRVERSGTEVLSVSVPLEPEVEPVVFVKRPAAPPSLLAP